MRIGVRLAAWQQAVRRCPDMGRTVLIAVFCLALAFLGASGLHAHLPASSPSAHVAVEHGLDHDHAQLVTLFAADHFHAHEEHGERDIDPMTKAFGKLSLLKAFTGPVFVLAIVGLLSRAPERVVRFPPPLRPPRNRLRLSLLPPSHAPPHTA